MEKTDIKHKVVTVIIIAGLLLNFVLLVSSRNNAQRLETKVIQIAQDLDRLKFDFKSLDQRRVGTESQSGGGSSYDGSLMIMLQNRLSEMKKEIENLKKKSGESPALSEYREREERLWREHAEKVKEAWTANLLQSLNATGFDPVEKELITEDYNIMLDKIKEEQIRWYHGDLSTEELTEASQYYSKEFFDNMSHSIGKQKASIVLGIIFPDPMVRKKILGH